MIPANPSKKIAADRDTLRAALQRAAILSNEKYRGIRLAVKPGLLTLQSRNPEREEAEEELEIAYSGDELEIGFNVNYLLDALAAVEGAARSSLAQMPRLRAWGHNRRGGAIVVTEPATRKYYASVRSP